MQSPKKLLLETSVQIDRFTSKKTEPALTLFKTSNQTELFSSFFVKYEFKTGLILNLIELYARVNLEDTPADAILVWSQKYETRKLKSFALIEALMLKNFEKVVNSKAQYLRNLEFLIKHLLDNFDSELKNIVGDFASDEIVNFKIQDKDSFRPFLTMYNQRKSIPQKSFWDKNKSSLTQLLKYKDIKAELQKKKPKAAFKYLPDVEKDTGKSDRFQRNKALGDAVIAVDCPKTFTLITLDKSFDLLCPALGKHKIIL